MFDNVDCRGCLIKLTVTDLPAMGQAQLGCVATAANGFFLSVIFQMILLSLASAALPSPHSSMDSNHSPCRRYFDYDLHRLAQVEEPEGDRGWGQSLPHISSGWGSVLHLPFV